MDALYALPRMRQRGIIAGLPSAAEDLPAHLPVQQADHDHEDDPAGEPQYYKLHVAILPMPDPATGPIRPGPRQ